MTDNIKISSKDLNLHYGDKHALRHIDMQIEKNKVTALIGPSGCGKSTFLRCLNRMNDLIESAKITGIVEVDGQNIYAKEVDPVGQTFLSASFAEVFGADRNVYPTGFTNAGRRAMQVAFESP